MRTLSPALKSHVSGEVTTLCWCWQIIRRDGVVLGFTDHDEDITFDGIIHQARAGLDPADTETLAGLSPGNGEIAGALDSAAISERDIEARLYDEARIVQYAVNWAAPDERVRLHTWVAGRIIREDGRFRAELRSITALLEHTGLRRFSPLCDAQLGDMRCGLDLAGSYTVTGFVEIWLDEARLVVGGLPARDAGWFAGGRLTFSSGEHMNASALIATDRPASGSSRTFELLSAMSEAGEGGEAVTLQPGCDKRFATCRERFSNGLNFRGFPHMPNAEFIARYASNEARMDGGPLFVDE